MKTLSILLFLAFSVFLTGCNPSNQKDAAGTANNQYANPFVGTAYTGHTFPGATYPLGLMQPGPETGNFDWKYCSGYNYEDPQIWGFSQTHLNGTGCPDLGDILMMPFSGTPASSYRSAFLKDSEKAEPGYYEVALTDNAVKVALTTTPRVAFHQYVFDKDKGSVYIDFQSGQTQSEDAYHKRVVESDITVENNQTIIGHQKLNRWVARDLFFVIQFDKPFASKEEVNANERDKAPKYLLSFDLKKGDRLQAKIAFSSVSIEGAKNNLKKELDHWNFNKVKQAAAQEWGKYLSQITVEGSLDQKNNFYTSLYHLFIQPNNIADTNGQYRNAVNEVASTPSGAYYSTFSLWDTYRAAHPLYELLQPEKNAEFVNSMLAHAEAKGYLPIWALWGKENHCMIGNHSIPVIVEACLKNTPGIDPQRAFSLIKKSLTENHTNSDWAIYDQYGYYPFDLVKVESVSRTLESVYDDYCASLLAQKLNLKEEYEFFKKRSDYYKNLFDPQTGFMRGKDSNGKWRDPFNPYALSHAGSSGGDYTEGNACQYTWHVQHDVDGLVQLMGGKEPFRAHLDSLFTKNVTMESTGFVSDVTGLIGQYAHGNEPSHHVVYLYSLIGEKWRTDELIREIFDKFYQPKPDGLCGNDDCGQMSAWYIFSALGFYPVDPVSGQYVLGAPQIPGATIQLPNGKQFSMIAHNLSEPNKYVKSIKLNGVELKGIYLKYDQIMEGGTLEFEMTDTPQKGE